MSDLYDADASPLKVAHRHLTETDPLYKVSVLIAPIALAVAVVAGGGCLMWPSADAAAQAPPAVPAAPSAAAAPRRSQPQAGPSASASQLDELRNRAVSDTGAFNALRKYADAGNPAAEFEMGTLYDPTLTQLSFAHKDIHTSFGWYLKSAEHGFSAAMTTTASAYLDGWGVAKNDAAAAQWYLQAAERGQPQAQYQLGVMMALGRGLPKDCPTAKNWLEDAKKLGYEHAASVLSSGAGGACQW